MLRAMVKTTQLSPRTLARFRRALQRQGILHKTVAAEAGVSKFLVSHVLAGRCKSQNVINTMKRLTAPPRPTEAAR
jgi:hypothetical protein